MLSADLTPAQLDFLAEHVPGFAPERWTAETAGRAGSDRRFVRVRDTGQAGTSYILIVWDSGDPDWDRFLTVARGVADRLDVLPVVHAADPRHGLILEEDLGSITLKRLCAEGDSETVMAAYRRVLECAAQWHALGASAGEAVAERAMDREMFLWETGYFADHCVQDYFGRERLLGPAWEREREELAAAAACLPRACMHRDFQSENILIAGDRVRFVDFQGARMGPREYDLASLLLDPYVEVLDENAVAGLLDHYRDVSGADIPVHAFDTAAAQRLMQALGAFGNLSIHKGREWYRSYIPVALERLARLLARNPRYPTIAAIVEECRASLGG